MTSPLSHEFRPSIGITTRRQNGEGRFELSATYVQAVRAAGGYPVLLPPGETDPEECFEFLDGIVMTGGPDVDPARYGGKAHAQIYGVDPERDECEIRLARAIVELDKPALFICRGMQVLNVALGGTLVEHIPDEFGATVTHRGDERYEFHDVAIEPRSRLAKIVGPKPMSTPSWHHQSVRKVAPGWSAVAKSSDGVIEAMEHPDHEDLVAVQWHPEHTAAKDPRQRALFEALVATLRGD
jgi:putative glutamine amidotransferase